MKLVLVRPLAVFMVLECRRCRQVFKCPPTRVYADIEGVPVTVYYCEPCAQVLMGEAAYTFDI